MTTLGNICHFVRGPFGGALKKDFFVDDGYAVYEQQHAIYNQFEDIRYFVGSKKFEEMKRFELNSGDLIMSCSGTMGRIAIVPEGIKRGIINQALLKLTPKPEVDARYLKYWIESESFQSRLNDHTHGAAIKNVASVAVLKDLPIPVPPLPEQRRIAAILDQADALRAKRREALAQLDSLTQSIFVEMFGDPIDNPNNFAVEQLVNLVDPARPISYGILMPGPEVEDGIKYIRVVDMKNGTINTTGIRKTTSEISNQYRRSLLRTGDLLMSIRGHVGRFAVIPSELDGANITQDSARLAIKGVSAIYVRECLRTVWFQRWMARHTKGVAVQGINLGDVKLMPIPLPSLEQQKTFEEQAIAIEKIITVQRITLNELDNLFASLQHRAFRGEL